LRRTGGTPFRIEKVEMKYPGDLFAPLGLLNQLRRDILDKAKDALVDGRRPDIGNVVAARTRLEEIDLKAGAKTKPRIPSLAVYADSLEIIKGAVEGGCSRIYFEPQLLNRGQKAVAEELIKTLRDALNLCSGVQMIWKWPRITSDKYMKFAVQLLNRAEVDGIMVEGMGAAELIAATNPDIPISGSSSLNVWNHLTLQQLASRFQRVTLSPELSSDQLAGLVAKARLKSVPEMELVVQGNLEVMITEDCLPCVAFKDLPKSTASWALQDFKRIFPLWLDNDFRTHILNAAETCLVDFMPRLFEISLDGLAIDARGRTGKYALEMLQIYIEAMELTEKRGASLERDLYVLKDRIRPMLLGGMTSGHFIKGLKDELS
jgi:putative protease